MEGTRLNLAAVERALLEDPNSFEFFTAVTMIERLRQDRARVGGYGDPGGETVHFSVNPSLSYPASEIQTLEAEDGSPARMSINFMGLTGPLGVLPYVYSQLVVERLGAKDDTLAAFLDMFHHRIISLFYLAWLKHRFALRFERDGHDPLSDHLLDLGGLGLASQQRIDDLQVRALSGYASLLAPEARSAVALEQMLQDFFAIPVSVEQFLGGWYRVETSDQCALDEEGMRSRLGVGAFVGDEVWDPQGRIRIRLGPLSRERFNAFLPTGEHHATMRTLARLVCHDQFEIEIQLVLKKDEVPGLSFVEPESEGERLGWSTWIRTAPLETHADQTVLRI